jgi:hypothetical protein
LKELQALSLDVKVLENSYEIDIKETVDDADDLDGNI